MGEISRRVGGGGGGGGGAQHTFRVWEHALPENVAILESVKRNLRPLSTKCALNGTIQMASWSTLMKFSPCVNKQHIPPVTEITTFSGFCKV